MSAPAQKTNGLPVSTIATQSPDSSSPITRSADSNALRLRTVGFVQSAPLSIVTSASGPAAVSTRFRKKVVVRHVLPDQGGAHAHADAEGGQAVADVALAHAVRELGHQPDARRGKWMAAGDRAAVRVQPLVLGRDAHAVAPAQHLHGERLVQLEEADVVDAEAGPLEHGLRRRDGAEPHQLRLDARVGEAGEPHLRLEAELLDRPLRGEDAGRRSVRQPGGVAGGDAAARTEGRRKAREALHRRVRPEELVAVGHLPAFVREDGHRDDRLAHDPVLPRCGCALLRADGEGVRVLLRQLREAVVQILGRRAHRHGGGVDEPLGDEARVEVDVLAHRVVAHVLDPAGQDDVGGAEADLAGAGRHRGERACAHAVDREARDGVRDAGEQRDVPSHRQSLVADLRGRGEDDVADPFRRELRVPAQHFAHDLDRHVVCARAPEDPLRACAAERGAHPVDEEDVR